MEAPYEPYMDFLLGVPGRSPDVSGRIMVPPREVVPFASSSAPDSFACNSTELLCACAVPVRLRASMRPSALPPQRRPPSRWMPSVAWRHNKDRAFLSVKAPCVAVQTPGDAVLFARALSRTLCFGVLSVSFRPTLTV